VLVVAIASFFLLLAAKLNWIVCLIVGFVVGSIIGLTYFVMVSESFCDCYNTYCSTPEKIIIEA
jgi:hypothetical protein